jgi:hypothetical protein
MPPRKFKLTLKNYFSEKRPHVSNSRMNDYLRSPAYYEEKYLGKNPDYKSKVTDPMKVGMAVDVWLTDSEKAFNKKYCRKFDRTVKRFKRSVKYGDDPETYIKETKLKIKQDDLYDKETGIIEKQLKKFGEDGVLSATIYDKALQVTKYIAAQPFWAEGDEDAYYQVPLEGEVEGLQMCGLPDRIDPLGDTRYRLIDLKVVSAMKTSSAKKWFWNAEEMGYLRQLALYQYLWAEKQGVPVKNIECCHAAASYVQPGITRVSLYVVPQSILDHAFEQVKEIAVKIKNKDFDEEPITWELAEQLGYENDNQKQDTSEWCTIEDGTPHKGSPEPGESELLAGSEEKS